jgi:demethylmenaquinone methyltransferase / 2-methoxy-6-polyprenyl-1,4-benzoquinol methylase
MANPYYQPGSDRAKQVNALFERIAPSYDRINDLQSFGLHRLWKRTVVRLADVRRGEQAIDICCGTGDIARQLCQAGASVVGLDFSRSMLVLARRGDRGTEIPIQWIQADALKLPCGDNTFDVVTVAFGLRNLSDFEAGLQEMCRITRPGGRLVILDFGLPDHWLWRSCYMWYLRYAVPVWGRLFFGDAAAYAYILESLKHYPAQAGIIDLLTQTGWRHQNLRNLLGGVTSIHLAIKPK